MRKENESLQEILVNKESHLVKATKTIQQMEENMLEVKNEVLMQSSQEQGEKDCLK